MRASGRIAAEILKDLQEHAKPGVTTMELNARAIELVGLRNKQLGGVKVAFKGYEGFPAAACTSLNEIIVHGVPNKVPLKEGDSLGLDFGVTYKGWYSDTAITIPIGEVSPEVKRIIRVCQESLNVGIAKARVGSTTGDIGAAVQQYVEKEGYGIVRNLCGHGVGKDLHESPEVPNFGKRHEGVKLVPGMVIAIEPMIVAGSPLLRPAKDGYGYETKDKSLTAHFEHTVAITEKGAEVLTRI
ncbi:MAG: type I methionyl aminopeptidase [Parcubacteria group bacterium]|nr:type I methionyl aminopeptidase [Parcubacteria group bacterium]